MKAADHEAISGALKKLKLMDAYIAAGGEEQTRIEVACRAKVIEKWYIGTLLSFNFY